MFNVLVIVALSAAVAAKSGASALIDHRVVARDVSFYTCSIFMLVASASDGQIVWWEVRCVLLSGLRRWCFRGRYKSEISDFAPRDGGLSCDPSQKQKAGRTTLTEEMEDRM